MQYIAGQEQLQLTEEGAAADRSVWRMVRCAGCLVDPGYLCRCHDPIDADIVRRMAGVTDRGCDLFELSDALEAQDGAAALALLARLRQQSVDVKRLTEELIAHYRALMLAALPGGKSLLSGVSPEEEARYLEQGPKLGQRAAVRAIRTLGTALEHMTRGSDQRIELELALFSLSEPPQAAQTVVAQQTAAPSAPQREAPRPFASAQAAPFVSAPVEPVPAAAVQETAPQSAAQEPAPLETAAAAPSEEMPPLPWDEAPPPPEEQPPILDGESVPAVQTPSVPEETVQPVQPVYPADPGTG